MYAQALFSSSVRVLRFVFAAAMVWSTAAQTTLIPTNAVWKYRNTGVAPGDGWRSVSFNDSEWKSGPAKLGYGDGDEATVTEGATITPHPITAYFRTAFTTENPTNFTRLILRLRRDDGAVVYLNGAEILRNNMPDGVITAETLAVTTVGADGETTFLSFELPASGLMPMNVLSAEVHQVNSSSSDMGFALELVGATGTVPILPVVSISATVPTTSEPNADGPAAPGKLTITRTGSLDAALPVYLGYEGTATAGSDYVALSNRVEIPAGMASIEMLVVANADSLSEPAEFVAAHLKAPPTSPDSIPYRVSADRGSANVYILNYTKQEDVPIVSIVATQAGTTEPSGGTVATPGRFSISRTGNLGAPLKLFLQFGGTATMGADYAELAMTVEIPQGTNSIDVLVTAKADSVVEGTETVVASFSLPPGPGVAPFRVDPDLSTATVSINDGTVLPPPVVSITSPVPNTSEPTPDGAAAPGKFTITRSGSTAAALPVYLSYEGSATAGADYAELPKRVEIPIGASSIDLLVAANADPYSETVETVIARVNPPPKTADAIPYLVSTEHGSASVYIFNYTKPEDVPILSIVATQDFTAEPGVDTVTPPGKFTITRTGNTGAPLKAFLQFQGTATMGADYVELPQTVEIPAGTNSITLLVTAKADSVIEDTETVVASFMFPPGPGIAPFGVDPDHAKATVSIKDSTAPPPPLPVVSIEATVAETSEPLITGKVIPGEFTLRRTGPTNSSLTVYVHFGGTATAGSDYEGIASFIQFQAGESFVTRQVFARSDDLVEGDETVVGEVTQPPTLPPAKTYEISADRHRAVVTIHDEDRANPATLVITDPHAGDTVFVGTVVTIKATAVDPSGYIPRVEFFDGTNSIGVSQLEFLIAPTNGTPIFHQIQWKVATKGEHVLTAKGVSANGSIVISKPVSVIAADGAEQVHLALEVTDGVAVEPGITADINAGLVVIKRVGGATNVDLNAFYTISGSASNGVDYAKLSGIVHFESGQMRAEIHVVALRDSLVEGDENVVITLQPPVCPAIFPPPPSCYLIDGEASGQVVIHDAVAPNLPPKVAIGRPVNGAVFTLGTTIDIVAEAGDADGIVTHLQINADGNLLGAGNTNRLALTWSNAPVGEHILIALATDNSGATGRSAEVHILVRQPDAVAFVTRHLPPSYTPGAAFHVELRAEPPASAHAYAIEDRPPEGWGVTDISNDGFFDRTMGKVKFGPFTDATARTLTYTLTPPATATGRKEFGGASSIDGVSYPIGGDRLIEQGATFHPADKDKSNSIVLNELTAYAAAWKMGSNWEIGPNPIPLSYVTRAGFLWKHGEVYRFDGSKEPPLCWVSTQPTAPDGGSDILVERSGEGLIKPGSSTEIQIKVTPSTLTSAYGIEERVPEHWTVSNISDDGSLDTSRGVIRWGAYLDNTNRTLRYTLTAPAQMTSIAHLSGSASFDGTVRGIPGRDRVIAMDDSTRPRIEKCETDVDGHVHIHLSGTPGQVGILQRSGDLDRWEDVATLYLPDGTVDFTDDSTVNIQYYRLQMR